MAETDLSRYAEVSTTHFLCVQTVHASDTNVRPGQERYLANEIAVQHSSSINSTTNAF